MTLDVARIYEAEFQFVWNILKRYGAKAIDLEDLCHDVFIVVQRRLHTFDTQRSIRPWLSGIAFRVLSDFKRKAYHQREVSDEVEVEDKKLSPEAHSTQNQQLRLAKRALAKLSFNNRIALVMHDLEGFSAPEIAEALELPLNTVYSRVRLARQQLKAEIKTLEVEGACDER